LGIQLLLAEEFEVVIIIEVATGEMHGSGRLPDLNTDFELVGWAIFPRKRNGAFLSSACSGALGRCLQLPTLLKRTIYRQRGCDSVDDAA
jgi:hypothetical protein